MKRQLFDLHNDIKNESPMMTIQDVAKLLQCSDRHITNLRNGSRIPQPVKIGIRKGVRWPRQVIEEWIAAGCPALAV